MSVRTTVAEAAPQITHRYELDSGLGELTPAERAARGKEARAAVPRESHAVFDPGPDRPDPIGLLEEQAKSRVPELVPIRRGRMMVSPFTFYRGAALPMASDLATTPVSGLAVQACGDAHLSNFGIFGSPERLLVFDVNDFDETTPGPWEWDVKRLATSMEVAARGNGFGGKDRREIVTATVARYRQAMRDFAKMTNLAVWYAHTDLDQLRAEFESQLKKRQVKMVDKGMAKARTRDSMQELAKLTLYAVDRGLARADIIRVRHLGENQGRGHCRRAPGPRDRPVAIQIPVPEGEDDDVGQPDGSTAEHQHLAVAGEGGRAVDDVHGEQDPGRGVGHGDDTEHADGEHPQPRPVPVDASRVPDDQHAQEDHDDHQQQPPITDAQLGWQPSPEEARRQHAKGHRPPALPEPPRWAITSSAGNTRHNALLVLGAAPLVCPA